MNRGRRTFSLYVEEVFGEPFKYPNRDLACAVFDDEIDGFPAEDG